MNTYKFLDTDQEDQKSCDITIGYVNIEVTIEKDEEGVFKALVDVDESSDLGSFINTFVDNVEFDLSQCKTWSQACKKMRYYLLALVNDVMDSVGAFYNQLVIEKKILSGIK